jgi:hypothetical protein
MQQRCSVLYGEQSGGRNTLCAKIQHEGGPKHPRGFQSAWDTSDLAYIGVSLVQNASHEQKDTHFSRC